jgi:hypothetical protein
MCCEEVNMSTFGIYLIGFILVIAGLAYAAHLMGLAPLYIGIGVVILLGLGILTGVTRTKQRDPSEAE